MALDKILLRDSIDKLAIRQSSLSSQILVANEWSKLYSEYASSVETSVTKMLPGILVQQIITAGIIASPLDFFLGLSNGLMSYWISAAWIIPGFTGVTTQAAGLYPMLLSTGVLILSGNSTNKQAAIQLSDVLHNYTKSIVITATNASGVTTTENLL